MQCRKTKKRAGVYQTFASTIYVLGGDEQKEIEEMQSNANRKKQNNSNAQSGMHIQNIGDSITSDDG